MNIRIITIGKLKEKYWQDAVKEYSKRLGAYCNLEIVELKESLLRANASAADEEFAELISILFMFLYPILNSKAL